MVAWKWGKEEGQRDYKRAGGNFEDDRYVHYPDHGDVFMSEDRCQILSYCTFKVYIDYCMLIIPRLSC